MRQVEEQRGSIGVERDVVDFVDHDLWDTSETFAVDAEAVGPLGIRELGDPFGRRRASDPVTALGGLDVQYD